MRSQAEHFKEDGRLKEFVDEDIQTNFSANR